MNMGQSAGRSRGNSVRPAARRRFDENERSKNTHIKDDPNQWPDPVNTVMTISGRILAFMLCGVISGLALAVGRSLHSYVADWLTIGAIMLCGQGVARAVRWETTRRL